MSAPLLIIGQNTVIGTRTAVNGLLNVRSTAAPIPGQGRAIHMIDRIRQDIQDRLDQLLAEADRLREALSALGGESRQGTSRSTGSGSSTRSRSRSRSSGTGASRTRGSGTTSSRSRGTSSSRGRGSAGGTKSSVLQALSDASGSAMTASEVASATGLGRASVSTTLSKLAKSGEVTKADRGYQLSTSGTPAASGSGS